MKATALCVAIAIAAGTSGCRTAPRMVPMVIDGKPAMALAFGENPQGDIDWLKTGGAATGFTALFLGGLEYYSRNKGGTTGRDRQPDVFIQQHTNSGNPVVILNRDGTATASTRRDAE